MAQPLNPTSVKAILAGTWIAEAVLLWYFSTHEVHGQHNAAVLTYYETYLTPAEYSFSIWALIVFMQGAFVVYHCTRDALELSQRFLTAWAVCMITQGLWSVPFDYRLMTTCLLLLLVLLACLVVMYQELFPGVSSAYPELSGRYLFGKTVVPLQLAWTSVETFLQVAMALTDWGWTADARGAVGVAVAVQLLAACLPLFVLWTRNDLVFAAVFIWAFYAIRDHQDQHVVKGTATILAALVACACLVHFCAALFGSLPGGYTSMD